MAQRYYRPSGGKRGGRPSGGRRRNDGWGRNPSTAPRGNWQSFQTLNYRGDESYHCRDREEGNEEASEEDSEREAIEDDDSAPDPSEEETGSDTEDEGGYDYDFVELTRVENDGLNCLICQSVVKDPQQSECCGKLFCKVCVERLQEEYDPACPNCRYQPFVSFADKHSNRIILGLKVNCTRRKKGCQWQGSVRDVQDHVSTKCDYQVVHCANQCGRKFYQWKYKSGSHLSKYCPKRPFQCTLCYELDQWDYITGDHVEVCPDVELECLNEGCGEMVKRKNCDQHQSYCPKKVVWCDFADLGCKENCTREDKQYHNESHIHQHLMLATKVARSNILLNETPDHLLQVAPVILRIPNFSENDISSSQPFLSNPRGYRMALIIDHSLEVSIQLMQSCIPSGIINFEFFRSVKNVTVTLLNQIEDRNHLETSYKNFSSQAQFGKAIKIGIFHINFNYYHPPCYGQQFDKFPIGKRMEQMGYLVNDTVCVKVVCTN